MKKSGQQEASVAALVVAGVAAEYSWVMDRAGTEGVVEIWTVVLIWAEVGQFVGT
jgi:predicted alpha/beta hydrolase